MKTGCSAGDSAGGSPGPGKGGLLFFRALLLSPLVSKVEFFRVAESIPANKFASCHVAIMI